MHVCVCVFMWVWVWTRAYVQFDRKLCCFMGEVLIYVPCYNTVPFDLFDEQIKWYCGGQSAIHTSKVGPVILSWNCNSPEYYLLSSTHGHHHKI